MSAPGHEVREVSQNQFGDRTIIHQGNVQGNIYYGTSPHSPDRAKVDSAKAVRVIPYPRNEDLVNRQDLTDRLDKLLPQTSPGPHSAALWGLGGSGKTQIALDYAYRRCDTDKEYCVFWVHADSEATFLADYKTIGKKLGIDERLNGTDLLDAVRHKVEDQSKWLVILDNADDLRLFGVGSRTTGGQTQDLRKYVPCTSQGTVLWTSRDAHIAGTLVGARRSVQVQSMKMDEATTLLSMAGGDPPTLGEVGAEDLLKELQCLPLAISQAGAYMRRMSMTATEYLSRLRQGKTRWELLKVSDTDRYRRPEASNSVLETWRISTERIRAESELSYRILHTIAYVDGQEIPQELIAIAASRCEGDEDKGESTTEASGLEVMEAVARLKEFSFLSLRQEAANGGRSYEMHKLVREALQYELGISSVEDVSVGKAPRVNDRRIQTESFYSGRALMVVDDLFPSSEPSSWARCEQYLRHAIQVGEWAELSGTEIKTASLLERVSDFLCDRGRWREKESVDNRVWSLRREVLGEEDTDTISSIVNLARTYGGQGRYNEAERLQDKVLRFRQELLGEEHPDTIGSIANIAATYYAQGRYNKAERLQDKVLRFRQELLGEEHPDTIGSIANLAATYYAQGRYNEVERLDDKVLRLQQELLGEEHPDTIGSIENIAATYYAQGRYNEAERLEDKVLRLRQELLGEEHPDTIGSIAALAKTYYAQGRYNEAEELNNRVLRLQQELLGEEHPDTMRSMASLAVIYHGQGRYNEAEELNNRVLRLQQELLGEEHPDTMRSMASLAVTYHGQGRYNEAEQLHQATLNLHLRVLGESHPDTLKSLEYLTMTQEALQQLPFPTELDYYESGWSGSK